MGLASTKERAMIKSNNSAGGVEASEGVKGITTQGVTSDTAKNTQQYLSDYNTNREQKIKDMYAQNMQRARAQQQTALDASEANIRNAYQQNVNAMRNAYEQNMSDAEAARAQISPRYQQGMNALSAEYERQRRNNNMQAAVNGLNTGAGSQLALGQSMAYQGNQGQLSRSEQEALNEADRGIGDMSRDYYNRNRDLEMQYTNNITDLKTNYQNKIAEAAANNDYQQAAALLDEYGAQYDRTMNQAKQLAEYGDFSMFANIYGVEAAQQMEKNWALQNPDLAYNLGRISADDYFAMTGKYPNGYEAPGSGAGGVSGGKGGLGGGSYGYSAGRDTAYRGPAGFYDGYGNFAVGTPGNVSAVYGSARYESDAGQGLYGQSMTANQAAWYNANR